MLDKSISVRFANMSVVSSLMVVAIHVLKRNQVIGSAEWWLRRFVEGGICRIAVPFFFLAAGYFVAQHFSGAGYWKMEVLKRCRTLLVPFAIWASVAFVVCSVIAGVDNVLSDREWCHGLFSAGRLAKVLGVNPFVVPELRQLWFIRVLFIFMCVLPLFKAMSSVWGLVFLFAIYAVSDVIGLGGRYYSMMRFGVYSVSGAAYFTLGMYLAKNDRLLRLGLKASLALYALGLASIVLWTILYGVPYVGALLVGGIFALLVGSCNLIKDTPMFGAFAGYSFPRYLVHLIVVFVYFAILDAFHASPVSYCLDPGISITGAFVGYTIVMLFSLLICWTLRRFKVLWGGR